MKMNNFKILLIIIAAGLVLYYLFGHRLNPKTELPKTPVITDSLPEKKDTGKKDSA